MYISSRSLSFVTITISTKETTQKTDKGQKAHSETPHPRKSDYISILSFILFIPV